VNMAVMLHTETLVTMQFDCLHLSGIS
jgi:hypothetical protein